MTSPGFSELYAISESGTSVNEDLFGAAANCAWVLDGATGHRDEPITAGETDGQWYVEQLNDVFEELADTDRPLPTMAREAVAEVRERFLEIAPDELDRGLDIPAAAGVLVRRLGTENESDGVEYLILGDCTLLVEKEHTTVAVSDRRGAPKEQEQIEAMQRALDAGVDDPWEARKQVEDVFLQNKGEVNSPGGYWVFSLESDAVEEALTGRFTVGNGLRLHLMTDGFSSLVDTYHRYNTWESALRQIEKQGPRAVLSEIREAEASDPSLRTYPRTKRSDDATLLSVTPKDV